MNMSNKSLFLQVVITNCDENIINLSLSRLQNPSRLFSQYRLCEARNAGVRIWREGRGPGHTRRTRLAPH